MTKKNILQSISAEEALTVLQQLVATSSVIRKKAEGIALALLADIDVDGVADEVLWALESLAVEGSIKPARKAVQMSCWLAAESYCLTRLSQINTD